MSEYIDIPHSASEIPAKVSAYLMLKLVKNKAKVYDICTTKIYIYIYM